MPLILALVTEKRIIFAIVLALALAISGFWFFNKSGGKKTAINTTPTFVATAKTAVESPDSDSDGLKDWEEKLWGTNSDNPDTDGDGTTDGEEIKLNRDPLVKGPNDKLNAAPLPIQETTQPNDLNLTQKTTRDLFVSYIQQRQAGIDPASASDQIANAILDENGVSDFKNSFFPKDLKIISGASGVEIKNYINELARISSDGGAKIKENELKALERLVKQSNSSDSFEKFEEFTKNSAIYGGMVSKISKLQVPQNYASSHLQYLNALNNLGKINSVFSVFMSDPISGVGAVRQYLDEAENIKSALLTLSVATYSDQLAFGPEEYGFALLNLISQLQ